MKTPLNIISILIPDITQVMGIFCMIYQSLNSPVLSIFMGEVKYCHLYNKLQSTPSPPTPPTSPTRLVI